MPRFVLSTIGTSLLTQQIDRDNREETDWSKSLSNHANLKLDETPENIKQIIEELQKRATEKLNQNDIPKIRRASAELNGIYGLYEEQLEQGKQDIHWLVATDTAQGEATAKIVQSFLEKHGIVTQILQPNNLSATSTEAFTNGIDELLEWIDQTLPGYRDSDYRIIFNLVGGFKSLQAYLNTIGMFYANEIIYIFEGVGSKLITIPRLPINIDDSRIKPVEFALMSAKVAVKMSLSELENVPEALLYSLDEEVTLSNWGKLTWNNCKQKLLTQDLLPFPKLIYEKSFEKDYRRNNVNAQRKLDLHEVLAEISGSMIKFAGDTTKFSEHLHYTRYEGGQKCEGGVRKNELDHFYIKNTGWRVSCLAKDGKLYLRHYGEHDYVQDNP